MINVEAHYDACTLSDGKHNHNNNESTEKNKCFRFWLQLEYYFWYDNDIPWLPTENGIDSSKT